MQNTYEFEDSLSWFRGKHSVKFGGNFRRTQINAIYGDRTECILCICRNAIQQATRLPISSGKAGNLLPGIGDFSRGLRNWGTAAFAQDEWRVSERLTINYGLRWEIINPKSEIRNRLSTFVPGYQSKVYPDAPPGILVSVIPVFRGIAPT